MVFLRKNILLPLFLVKNAKNKFLKKNNVYEDKCFLSKMSSQIKMQAATNWSNHLKNIKHLIFSNDRFLMQFSKITFPRVLKIICSTRKITV